MRALDTETPWWVCSMVLAFVNRRIVDRACDEEADDAIRRTRDAIMARVIAGEYVCTADGDIVSPVLRCRTEAEARACVDSSGIEPRNARIVYVGAV